jgi:hypothetical protein
MSTQSYSEHLLPILHEFRMPSRLGVDVNNGKATSQPRILNNILLQELPWLLYHLSLNPKCPQPQKTPTFHCWCTTPCQRYSSFSGHYQGTGCMRRQDSGKAAYKPSSTSLMNVYGRLLSCSRWSEIEKHTNSFSSSRPEIESNAARRWISDFWIVKGVFVSISQFSHLAFMIVDLRSWGITIRQCNSIYRH